MSRKAQLFYDRERQDYIQRLLKTIKRLQIQLAAANVTSASTRCSVSDSDLLAVPGTSEISIAETSQSSDAVGSLKQSYESAVKENLLLQRELNDMRTNFETLIDRLDEVESERRHDAQILALQVKVHREDFEAERREKEAALSQLAELKSELAGLRLECDRYKTAVRRLAGTRNGLKPNRLDLLNDQLIDYRVNDSSHLFTTDTSNSCTPRHRGETRPNQGTRNKQLSQKLSLPSTKLSLLNHCDLLDNNDLSTTTINGTINGSLLTANSDFISNNLSLPFVSKKLSTRPVCKKAKSLTNIPLQSVTSSKSTPSNKSNASSQKSSSNNTQNSSNTDSNNTKDTANSSDSEKFARNTDCKSNGNFWQQAASKFLSTDLLNSSASLQLPISEDDDDIDSLLECPNCRHTFLANTQLQFLEHFETCQ